MKDWKPDCRQESCFKYYGNMRQICGTKHYKFLDGKAANVEAVDVSTGSGLSFTVLPGRGMDISMLSFRGIPVSYLSKAGITAPSYHDPRDEQWLKSFFAGMLTTCGLTNAGPACRDKIGILQDVPFGLHGDISNTAADNVCVREEWVSDGGKDPVYQISVSGRMEEGRLHGEHLQLRRTVETAMGEKNLHITDEFSNLGNFAEPLMFFYHINVGYPLLDENSRFVAPSRKVTAETTQAKANIEKYAECLSPQREYLEQQFFHDMACREDGTTLCAVINDELEIGCFLRYNVHELPQISQWKVMREGEYVMAMEPGNCRPIGRNKQRELGFEMLQPMESRFVHMEIGIADGEKEIAALQNEIAEIQKQEARIWGNRL